MMEENVGQIFSSEITDENKQSNENRLCVFPLNDVNTKIIFCPVIEVVSRVGTFEVTEI